MSNEIKEIRHATGLPANVFARLIGSNVCSIYNFEAGRTSPRYPHTIKRAKALLRLFNCLENNPDFIIEKFKEISGESTSK